MKQYFRRLRRAVFEKAGNPKYTPRPSLNDLDSKLSKYLDYTNGFFIEVGANDGYRQSNTYYLERGLKWRGLLVEAIPELYERCRRLRKNSRVFHNALVAPDFPDDEITMQYAGYEGLMSIAEGSMSSDKRRQEHIDQAHKTSTDTESYTVHVPVRTLESILDEIVAPPIDIFSLDVEGYELNVLLGMNIEKYRPEYILVEVWEYDKVDAFLKPYYDQVDQLTFHDYLYRVRSAGN